MLLLLGGGMAAGKSTVREVIGHDDFWSKVWSRLACSLQGLICPSHIFKACLVHDEETSMLCHIAALHQGTHAHNISAPCTACNT